MRGWIKTIGGDVRAALVGTVTVALLGSLWSLRSAIWNATKEQSFQWTVSVYIALFGVALSLVALIALVISGRKRPDLTPFLSKSPRLVLINQGVSTNVGNEVCFFFTVKNAGSVTVKKAEFTFVIQTQRLAKPPVVQHEPTSQPIVEGTTRQISYSFPKVDPEPAYIAFYVSYIGDGQEKKWDNDPVFLVWRGIQGNTMHRGLEYLRDQEINRFKEYLRRHTPPKPLL